MPDLTSFVDVSLTREAGFSSSVLPDAERAWAEFSAGREASLWVRSAPGLIEFELDAVLYLLASDATDARQARELRRALLAWWVSEGRSHDLSRSVPHAATLDSMLGAAIRHQPWRSWWKRLGTLPGVASDTQAPGLAPPETAEATKPDAHPARLPLARAAAFAALRGAHAAALGRRAARSAPHALPVNGLLASAVGEVLMDREVAERIRRDLRAGTEAALFYLPTDFLSELDGMLAGAISAMR